MKSNWSSRVLGVAAVLGLATLAACSSEPPPPLPPPLPPPAAADFTLAPSVVQAAAAYQAYMSRASAISPAFQDGQAVADALRTGESYDPQRLIRGEIAFAAVTALQDPAFVAELRSYSVDPDGRRQMIDKLNSDPYFVTAFKASATAAGLAERALLAQGEALEVAGEAVKREAYDMQHQAWSTQWVPDRDARLAQAKTVSGDMPAATIEDADRMRQAAEGSQPMPLTGAPVAQPPYPNVIVRGLDIAALALLGAAGDQQADALAPLLEEPREQTCLSMAKLNLYQCLAVAKPHYEDVFCLGQHVMMDTAQCVRFAAGAPEPTVAALAVSSTETPYAHKPRR